MSFLSWRPQIWTQVRHHEGRTEGDNPLPALCHPCFCSPGYCWPSGLQEHTAGSYPSFFPSGPPNCPPQSCFQGVLPGCTHGVVHMGLPQTKCSILDLALLNLVRFTGPHFLSLPRSLWMVSLPSVVSTVPLSLLSSVNLLRVHSIPLCYSFHFKIAV